MPGHLDGFELFLVGVFRIVVEAFELHDPFVEIGETHGQRIGVRELVGECDGDVFGLVQVKIGSLDFPHAFVFQCL